MRPTALPRAAGLVSLAAALIAGCGGATSGPASAPAVSPAPTVSSPGPTAASTSAPSSPAPTGSAPASPDADAAVAWILYQSPDGLRRMLPDGAGSHRALPDGPPTALHADWAPDGLRFAFNVDESDGTRDIWTAAWDGSDTRRLVDCQAPCRDADSPAWSPDGTRIAFGRIDNVNGHNPGSKVQVVDVAAGTITTVAATRGAEYAGGPRWSPDGRSLVVGVDRYIDDGNDTTETTGTAIAVVRAGATPADLHVIVPFAEFASYPDWHPTDDLILFARGALDPLDPQGDPSNLFTIRSDGTGKTALTHQGAADDGLWMPAFRPDGSGILATFVHRPSGNLTLAVLGLDGSGLAELGGATPVSGAHSRQRQMPATP